MRLLLPVFLWRQPRQQQQGLPASYKSFSVSFQNIREKYSVGKSMWNIVLSSQRMGNCMYIAYIGFCKSAASEIRGAEHIPARFFIASVGVSSVQIFENQLHCIPGIFTSAWCSGITNISFHCVGSASIPVVAVMNGGRLNVTLGSSTAYRGISGKSLMAYLCRVSASTITAASVVSLPVPAVVGTAIRSGSFCALSGFLSSLQETDEVWRLWHLLPWRSPYWSLRRSL